MHIFEHLCNWNTQVELYNRFNGLKVVTETNIERERPHKQNAYSLSRSADGAHQDVYHQQALGIERSHHELWLGNKTAPSNYPNP